MKKTKTVQRTITTETRADGKTVRTETIVTTVDDPRDLDSDSSPRLREKTLRENLRTDDRSLWEMIFGRD